MTGRQKLGGDAQEQGSMKAGPGLQSLSCPHCPMAGICMLVCSPADASRNIGAAAYSSKVPQKGG